jgi:predicted nucleotidyltransferase
MSFSIDLEGSIDRAFVDVIDQIHSTAESLGIPFFVVGATARDLVMQHGYGIDSGRATKDIDLGALVSTWDVYHRLKKSLIDTGHFQEDDMEQRVRHDCGLPVDIVPFGSIDNGKQAIFWPPRGDTMLNVLGFDEAYDSSLLVRIRREPSLIVKVASPIGLVMMKLIAWDDRRSTDGKDAEDFWRLLLSYLELGNTERLFQEHPDIVEVPDFDFELAGIQLLARDLVDVAGDKTRNALLRILNQELSENGNYSLATSGAKVGKDLEQSIRLLTLFRDELRDAGA